MTETELQHIRWSVVWHRNWMPAEPGAKPSVVTIGQLDEVFKVGAGRFAGPLTVPWPPVETQGFWERYLNRCGLLSTVIARECRRALVPLRAGPPTTVEATGTDTRVGTECFLHPWGASVVVTLNLKAPAKNHAQTAERLLELRHSDEFMVDANGSMVTLEEVAAAAFDRVRETHAPAAVETYFGEPFSILTVLEGSGPAADFDPVAEPTARFLHAAASFSLTWTADPLPALADATVARLSKERPATHLTYGERRGRVIWGPTFFNAPIESSILECLHRNQTLAAMQTEAMASFVADTVERIDRTIALSQDHKDRSRFAAEQLAQLHRGDKGTYRSGSMKAQIDAGRYVDPINRVLVENLRPKLL
jgi:hypothetical protein